MQGTLGNEGPKRLTTEERMKLLKDTLKKSSRLTENLLRRLDKEWEDVFKEESGTNVDQAFCAFHKRLGGCANRKLRCFLFGLG